MKDLLITIAKGLVDDPSAVDVTVDEINDEGIVVYHLVVAEDDKGRVIGKQGRIARSLETEISDELYDILEHEVKVSEAEAAEKID